MISVCLTTYNGDIYIKEQIDSILSQLTFADELIISDDGSTDKTLQIINSIQDTRIKLLNHHKKSETYWFNYTTRNVEYALQQAKGEIIFLSDQDDIWLPNKVQIMSAVLADYKLVVADCCVTDNKLNVIYASYFDLIHSGEGIVHNLVKNSYLGCCMAFRRDILRMALPIPKGPIAHDIWIGLIANMHNAVKFIDVTTMLYRRHDATVSTSSQHSHNSFCFKIYYRCYIGVLLCKHWIKSYNDHEENSTYF